MIRVGEREKRKVKKYLKAARKERGKLKRGKSKVICNRRFLPSSFFFFFFNNIKSRHVIG